MKKQSSTVRFLAYTALGIAMVIVAQLLGKALPAGAVIVGPFAVSQLVTGSLVNCILFVFAGAVGLWQSVCIGLLSALLASAIGVGPQILPIVPLIAVGNALIGLVYVLCSKKLPRLCAVILAAIVKCGFLWLSVPNVLKLIATVPEKQVKALSIMFSWPQGLTATIGGLLALIVLARLVKNTGKD